MSEEYLTLKWRTLKAWRFEETNERAVELLKRYAEIGYSLGAMTQRDTPEQKQIICDLIDVGDFETVCLDWDGVEVSKEEAKAYVMDSGS